MFKLHMCDPFIDIHEYVEYLDQRIGCNVLTAWQPNAATIEYVMLELFLATSKQLGTKLNKSVWYKLGEMWTTLGWRYWIAWDV